MPDVIKSSRPNIVFILTDQLRADSCGCYGQNPAITPVLDSLAAQGVKFNHAIAAHGTSTAARGILQTGKLASDTGCVGLASTLPQGVKTLAQYLTEAGYKTGYIGQWQLAGNKAICDDNGNATAEHAVEPSERGGYTGFWRAANDLGHTSDNNTGYVFDENGAKVEFSQGRNEALVGFAADFLNQVGSEPFFLTVAPFDPMPQRMLTPVDYLRQIYLQYTEKVSAREKAAEENNREALAEVQKQERLNNPQLKAEAEAREREEQERAQRKAQEQAAEQEQAAKQAAEQVAEQGDAPADAPSADEERVKKLTVNEDEASHWCYLCADEIVKSIPLKCNPPVDSQIFRPGLLFEYDNYLGECKQLDNALGALVTTLKDKGLYDNTVIIFASMCGTSFNSRNVDLNCATKDEFKLRTGGCHYATVKVPLVVAGGAVKTCRPVDDVVSNSSLTRTVLSLAGVEVPADIVGEDLLALAHTVDSPEAQGPQGKTPEGPNELSLPPHEGTITPGRVQQALVQISENRLGRAIVTDEFTYAICAPDADASCDLHADHYKDDFLYEEFSDPYQLYNKVLDRLYTDIKLKLREQLLDLIEQSEQQRPTVADGERYYPPLEEEEAPAEQAQ